MKTILLAIFAAAVMSAQASARQVVLTWEDLINPVGTTYSIYRAQGQCATATASSFVRIASAVTAKTYTDTSVNPGQYCYYATATYGIESDQSVPVDAKIKPAPPTKVTFTVQ